MTKPRIDSIRIQGFRAFGKKAQDLAFGSKIAAVWAPNSQGKTSLAEAFEFLLTGQIVRRQLMASTQDEFADALRNAHMPAADPVVIQATITAPDGSKHSLARTLTADYAKRQDCQTKLEIDGKVANDAQLATFGIHLSQPPLAAPVLAQHTLGYLFSAKPQDRATYFKTILEVTDLEELRAAVATLEAGIAPAEPPEWTKLNAAISIEAAKSHLQPLSKSVPSSSDLADGLDKAVAAVIAAAGASVPATPEERLTALETLLSERREKTFSIDGFKKKALADWTAPAETVWEQLQTYLTERGKVDKETRRLTALFREALSIPAVGAASGPLDCMLCGTEDSLTPERVAFIRARVSETETFQKAEKAVLDALRAMSGKLSTHGNAVSDALPRFLTAGASMRRADGFRVSRIRDLVGAENAALVDRWLSCARRLARSHVQIAREIRIFAGTVSGMVEDPDTLTDVKALRDSFDGIAHAHDDFSGSLEGYQDAETALLEVLSDLIDAASDTAGWQDLLDISGDPSALRAALVDRHSQSALKAELGKALAQIDKGNEKVLDDKFGELSDSIQYWWDLLRPGEATFFSAVKPRKGARRTVDFKAGLSVHADRSGAKLRDVIAVFSQSQLHCLGLSLFIARALHEGAGFIVLDDPILSSDEDYRAYFKANVLEELLAAGVQVIILTQDQKSWKDLEHRYLHRKIDMFQIAMIDPADGTTVTNTGDDLMAMITRIEVLARGGHADLRKQAGELLRNAAERFCKEVLVRHRWANGHPQAALSDYDGKNLGQLSPQVEPLMTSDPSHPGKLRSLGNELNPAKHDDGIPPQGTLKVALGDLRHLRAQYLR
ncbi:MAG: ATP-binding protein [Pseudomonadota bacterium]